MRSRPRRGVFVQPTRRSRGNRAWPDSLRPAGNGSTASCRGGGPRGTGGNWGPGGSRTTFQDLSSPGGGHGPRQGLSSFDWRGRDDHPKEMPRVGPGGRESEGARSITWFGRTPGQSPCARFRQGARGGGTQALRGGARHTKRLLGGASFEGTRGAEDGRGRQVFPHADVLFCV